MDDDVSREFVDDRAYGFHQTQESVFDQLSDALILYDPDFRITGVNRSAEKLFGMSSEMKMLEDIRSKSRW